jgi:hypothetical protein
MIATQSEALHEHLLKRADDNENLSQDGFYPG